jgi:hypothetical protein
MKALVIASLIFFSLRAMSGEVGEYKASECKFADQGKREAKVVDQEQEKKEVKEAPAKGKSV